MCCYFDDALLSDHDAYERMIANRYVTQEEASAVADFHSLADQYHSPGRDDYDTPAILSDPAWHKVVEAAQLAQSSLLPLLTNAFEVAALSDPLFDETTTYGFQAHYPDPANASPPIGPDRKNP